MTPVDNQVLMAGILFIFLVAVLFFDLVFAPVAHNHVVVLFDEPKLKLIYFERFTTEFTFSFHSTPPLLTLFDVVNIVID